MERVITKSWNISKTKNCLEENKQAPFRSLQKEDSLASEKEKKVDVRKSTDISLDDNYQQIIYELFKNRIFMAYENWDKTINVNSKIIQSSKDFVICECLVDKEHNIFEKMSFPRHLFNHIEDLKINPYVILTIQSKTGSTRIDVINGEKLVDKKVFELNEEWAELDDKDFNKPLDKPIRL